MFSTEFSFCIWVRRAFSPVYTKKGVHKKRKPTATNFAFKRRKVLWALTREEIILTVTSWMSCWGSNAFPFFALQLSVISAKAPRVMFSNLINLSPNLCSRKRQILICLWFVYKLCSFRENQCQGRHKNVHLQRRGQGLFQNTDFWAVIGKRYIWHKPHQNIQPAKVKKIQDTSQLDKSVGCCGKLHLGTKLSSLAEWTTLNTVNFFVLTLEKGLSQNITQRGQTCKRGYLKLWGLPAKSSALTSKTSFTRW